MRRSTTAALDERGYNSGNAWKPLWTPSPMSPTALGGLLGAGRMRRSTTAALSERGYNSGNAAGPRRNLSAHTLAATKPTICAMTLESAPFSAAVTS